MPEPEVLDLEFLARKALKKEKKPNFKRMAYFAGVECGLHIAYVYSKIDVKDAQPGFWTLLEGNEFPRPGALLFVTRLAKYTSPKFNFVLSWVPEPGLRLGDPGYFYSQGIKDAVRVAIKQVPFAFKECDGDDWQKMTLDWIDQKIKWAKANLEAEKNRQKFAPRRVNNAK